MGTVIGTPAYMSPEQAAGRLDLLGPASDIYSLGATLYALLTGTAPFDESEKAELLQQVQRGEWQPPRLVKPNTPPELDAICRKAMALQPQDRYATALALAADVEHCLADEPVLLIASRGPIGLVDGCGATAPGGDGASCDRVSYEWRRIVRASTGRATGGAAQRDCHRRDSSWMWKDHPDTGWSGLSFAPACAAQPK
jgi:serine/threonine protein kinase